MKSTKTIILLQFLFLTIFVNSNQQIFWNPETIFQQYKDQSIFDPQNYLKKSETHQHLSKVINEIQEQHKITLNIFIINKMDRSDIDIFTNDVSYLIFKADVSKEQNSIIIMVPIEQREIKIRTGKIAKKKLSDSDAAESISGAISYFKKSDYDSALIEIMKEIHFYVNGGQKSSNICWGTVLYIVVFILVLVLSCVLSDKSNLTDEERAKLSKIKNFYDKNTNIEDFIDSTCAICLEDLKKKDNDLDKEEKEIQQEEELRELNKEIKKEMKDDGITQLSCKHCFHTNCITKWELKSRNCPLCREKYQCEDENTADYMNRKITNIRDSLPSSSAFFTRIMEIQQVNHTNLRSIQYNFDNNLFTWQVPQCKTGNSSGSSYRSSWGRGSGGARSKW